MNVVVTHNELAVMRLIAQKQRRARPLTHLQIASQANLTDRTIRNIIRRLAASKLITMSDGKQGKAYFYQIAPAGHKYIVGETA
jgi:predicted transcriptional regulator